MDLFPYILVRTSGGPFEKLEALEASATMQILKEIYGLEQRITSLKQRLSDALYEIISSCTAPQLRFSLMNLRRDIFNGRDIHPGSYTSITPCLPRNINSDVSEYLQMKKQIHDLLTEGERVYLLEVTVARNHLRTLVKEDVLQRGLILSSQSLLRYGIPRWLGSDPQSLDKEKLQAERSLIKYVYRIYAKTSPFSTFTNLAIKYIPAGFRTASAPRHQEFVLPRETTEPKVVSHIRLNNELYQHLIGLLTKIPEVYRHFPLRANPTLERSDNYYICLVNSNNVESFQRVPVTPVLDLLIELTSTSKDGLVYGRLVQTIVDNGYIDAPPENIEAYIDHLIDYGFFEFNISVSGLNPDWDINLRERLSHLPYSFPLIDELLKTLKHMRDLASQYEDASVEKRVQILEDAFSRFEAIASKLHEVVNISPAEQGSGEETQRSETGGNAVSEDQSSVKQVFKRQLGSTFHLRPERMFFEDTTIDASPEIDETQLVSLVDSLHELCRETKRFENHLDERDKMLHYFTEKYGETATIDLLTFYEDYYREFKKPETRIVEKLQRKQNVPEADKKDGGEKMAEVITIPRIVEREKWNEEWLQQFSSSVKERMTGRDHEEMRLSLKHFKKANETVLNVAESDDRCSYDAFIQLFKQEQPDGQEKLMGVLNAKFTGFGKMMSRFLHLFDKTVSMELRDWNQSLQRNEIFADGCDSSVFNANMHPPLFHFEIQLPNGQNSLPLERQIPVTELQVSLAKKGDQLQLIHRPSGKRVHVFDVGFLALSARSQLFQILEQFTLGEIPSWVRLINSLVNGPKLEKDKRQIRVIPRIIYDDRIILQRKTWHIPKELIPAQARQESAWSYFVKVNKWRLDQGIPDEAFMYVNTLSGMEEAQLDPAKRINPDDRKPQYISFKSPLLINLFEKSSARVFDELILVEMLPTSKQLLKIANNHYVTEFVIEWYAGRRKTA